MKNYYALNYWENNGRFQTTGDKLKALIPMSGACPEQPKLNMLRRAYHCYHDLFNNGHSNRTAEFYHVFGFSPRKLYPDHRAGRNEINKMNNELNLRLNVAMDRFILDAAFENGVEVVEDDQEIALAKFPVSKVPEIREAVENLKDAMQRFCGLLDATASHQEQTLKEIQKMARTFADWVEPMDS